MLGVHENSLASSPSFSNFLLSPAVAREKSIYSGTDISSEMGAQSPAGARGVLAHSLFFKRACGPPEEF
jgi:hypothetical protein